MSDASAAPRHIGSPDADEFTKRHSRFYDLLIAGDATAAEHAFSALRSWAMSRCKKDPDFMAKWNQKNDGRRLTLLDMEGFAEDMKCVWHDQHLWDFQPEDEDSEWMVPDVESS